MEIVESVAMETIAALEGDGESVLLDAADADADNDTGADAAEYDGDKSVNADESETPLIEV